jgi:hypothetical protein
VPEDDEGEKGDRKQQARLFRVVVDTNVFVTRLWPYRVTFFVTAPQKGRCRACIPGITRTLIFEQTTRNSSDGQKVAYF